MRQINLRVSLFTVLLMASFSSMQAQLQNIVISTVRLENIRLQAPIDSVNKYLDKKIKLPAHPNESYVFDTLKASYKNMPIRLVFEQNIELESNKKSNRLVSIYCDHTSIGTKSGIALGYDKFELIRKLDGSYLDVYPIQNWSEKLQIFEKDKVKSVVELNDTDNGNRLIFYFENNVLYAIECAEQMGC